MNQRDNAISVAIIGSGNIGTDLMIKVMRNGRNLRMGAMVGIDPASEGLARAARLGVPTTANGIVLGPISTNLPRPLPRPLSRWAGRAPARPSLC